MYLPCLSSSTRPASRRTDSMNGSPDTSKCAAISPAPSVRAIAATGFRRTGSLSALSSAETPLLSPLSCGKPRFTSADRTIQLPVVSHMRAKPAASTADSASCRRDLQIKPHLASAFACQITSIAAKISAIAQIRMVMSIPFTVLLAMLLIRWQSNYFQYTTTSAFVNTFR